MAKPSLEATRWATDETNNTAPSSGQRDTGWTPGQDGVSDYDNVVKKAAYDWFEWLNQSQLNDGVANYTHVDTIESDHDFTGTGNLENIHTVYITLSSTGSDDWFIDGILDGTDKQEIQIFNLDATRYINIVDQAFSASTAANQIILPEEWTYGTGVATAGAQLSPGGVIRLRYHGASSRWRVVGHTGVRVLRRITVPTAGAQVVGGHTVDQGHITLAGTPAFVSFPLVTTPGSRIYSYTAYLQKTSSGSTTLNTWLYKRDGNDASAAAVGVGDDNTDNNPGYITMGETFASLTPGEVPSSTPSTQYFVEVSASSGGDKVLHVDFFVWVPL